MKKIPSLVSSFLILFSILLTPDCATITRRSKQRIPVTSDPVGATVIVNGVQQGITPLEIRLARKEKAQVIRIESPGYNPVEIQLKRKVSSGYVWADGLLGGIVGGVLALVIYPSPPGDGVRPDDDMAINAVIAMGWTLGAGVSFLVDLITGRAGYALRPTNLTVTLTKANGTPRVDTMVVDFVDFRDIRWIRVQRD